VCDGGGVVVSLFQCLLRDVAFGGGMWGVLCGGVVWCRFAWWWKEVVVVRRGDGGGKSWWW